MVGSLWCLTTLILLAQQTYGSTQWPSQLNCKEKVYSRSPATLQFYEDCFIENESQECTQKCVWIKQGIICRDGWFHYDVLREYLEREFGHHSTELLKAVDQCVDQHMPQPYGPSDAKCSNFASTWACIKDAYKQVCQFSTENFITSSINPALIRCQNTLAPSDKEYNRIWYECKKIHGEGTECQKVCQWRKQGILLQDGSWNQSQVEHWNSRVRRHHAEPHNKAYKECHEKNGNLIIDANDKTCSAARVHRNCENAASREICGYETPCGSFEFTPDATQFECNGRTYTRTPESARASEQCSVHGNHTCRAVCRLKTLRIIRDDFSFDKEKQIEAIKKEYGQDADAIVQGTLACFDKHGPYKGKPRCADFESLWSCVEDVHSTVCNSASKDVSQLYKNNIMKCHGKITFAPPESVAAARACHAASTNTSGRLACLWKKLGLIKDDDSIDMVSLRAMAYDKFSEHGFGFANGLERCSQDFDPRKQREGSFKYGAFLSCTKDAFLDACGYITDNWISTID